TNANILMQRADLALTVAKQKRHPYVLYSSEQTRGSRAPLRMRELRQAIVADQLFLLYQPKVNLKDGSVTGVEVLTRWQHPDLALISPDALIPVRHRDR